MGYFIKQRCATTRFRVSKENSGGKLGLGWDLGETPWKQQDEFRGYHNAPPERGGGS